MKDQLDEAVDLLGSWESLKVTEVEKSPSQKHLRLACDKYLKPSCNKRELFHAVIAKSLCIMKRARTDLEMPVGHLCARVTKSDENYWKI